MKTRTVKIGDEVDIPVGWEPIEFRRPVGSDEGFLKQNGLLCIPSDQIDIVSYPRLILRRTFDLEALREKLRGVHPPGTWFAKDGNGLWYGYEGKPDRRGFTFSKTGAWFHINHYSVTWPPGDWEHSPFQI